jgi:hypothetical protein
MLIRRHSTMPLTLVVMAAALVFGVQPGLLSRSLTTGLPCADCGPIRAAACCDACSSEAQACMDCCETYGFDARQSGGTPALSDVTSFVIGAHIPEAPGARLHAAGPDALPRACESPPASPRAPPSPV